MNNISDEEVVPLIVVDEVLPVGLEVIQGVDCVGDSVETWASEVGLVLESSDPSEDESSSLSCVDFNASN